MRSAARSTDEARGGGAGHDGARQFRLDGRVAAITGASSGLDAGFARALAQAGADVALAARREDQLHQVPARVRDAGRGALVVAIDVSDAAQCDNLAAAALTEFGRLDVLVNNAGLGSAVPALRETPEQFRQVLDVNLLDA